MVHEDQKPAARKAGGIVLRERADVHGHSINRAARALREGARDTRTYDELVLGLYNSLDEDGLGLITLLANLGEYEAIRNQNVKREFP